MTSRQKLALSGVLLTVLIGILGGVAVAEIPSEVKPYLWLSVPLLILCVVVFAIVNIVQARETQPPEKSESEPLPKPESPPTDIEIAGEPRREKLSQIPKAPEPYLAHPYPLQANFTGRASEREMLSGWLTSDQHGVLVLDAIGGMGKSALTWVWLHQDVIGSPLPGVGEAGALAEDERPEGVLWWSFYEPRADFAAFLTHALAYVRPELEQSRSPLENADSLAGELQRRRLLLVLDGFERELRAYTGLDAAYRGDEEEGGQGLRACVDPIAANFLRRLGGTPMKGRVLITSRLLPMEIEGLACCRHELLSGMAPDDAVTFFQAQGIGGARHEIVNACEPYQFHPLALRLLAGLITKDRQQPNDIRVAERHPLRAEMSDKDRRSHILEAAYEALDEDRRQLLGRIAAFRGPVSHDTLYVLDDSGNEQAFEAALDELESRGVLFFDPNGAVYDLHPVVRRYAYERLTDRQGVHARLRDHFAADPTPEEDAIKSPEDLAPVIELYHHTVGAGLFYDAVMLFDSRLHNPLYYQFGSYLTCIELLGALFPDGEGGPPALDSEPAQSWVLHTLANACTLSGQPRRALPLYELSNEIDRPRDEKTGYAIGVGAMANSQIQLGELKAAERNLRHRVLLCQEIGDQFEEAVGHLELGRFLVFEGLFDESSVELDAAISLFEQAGEIQGQGQVQVEAYRAARAMQMGAAEEGLEPARRAREQADEVAKTSHPSERDYVQAEWLWGWALVALARKQIESRERRLAEAEVHLREALTRCRRINLVELEPDILLAWAGLQRAQGNKGAAGATAEDALVIANRCEYRLNQADIHNFLALMALDEGDRESAFEHAGIAKERATCDGPPHYYKPAYEEAERLLDEATT